MAVITLSRQYASGGDEIAARVCELLDYRYFDKQLMVKVATEVGLSEGEVVDFSEERYEVRSFLSRLFHAGPGPTATINVWQADEQGQRTLTERQLDDIECAGLVRHTVLAAYQQGNVLIVGRGGQAILREKPGVLHIRIVASLDARMRYLRSQGMKGIAEMKSKLAERDKANALYLKRFYDVDGNDPLLYDLVINTDRISTDAAVQIISTAVRELHPIPSA